MDQESVPVAQRHALQIDRVKHEAKRLSNWTGAPLSQCQEVTARAIGATSWQALLNTESFIPDEELRKEDPDLEESLKSRYAEMGELLAEKFALAIPLGDAIAALWQPTALRPTLRREPPYRGGPRDNLHWTLEHDLGEAPSLPQGATLALASRSCDSADRLGLVVVRPGRRAMHMKIEDCLAVEAGAQLSATVTQLLASESDAKKLASSLRRALSKPGALLLDAMSVNLLRQRLPSAQVAVPWLQHVYSRELLVKKFAAAYPWRRDDYPGLKPSDSDTFWSHKFGPLTLQGIVAGRSICFAAHDLKRANFEHPSVQAGPAAIAFKHHNQIREYFPGFYLTKYGRDVRGFRPLPGVTADVAREISERTGLALSTKASTGTRFFSSDAGLAFARWVAARPSRVKLLVGDYEMVMGRPGEGACQRMFFELARSRALDEVQPAPG